MSWIGNWLGEGGRVIYIAALYDAEMVPDGEMDVTLTNTGEMDATLENLGALDAEAQPASTPFTLQVATSGYLIAEIIT